METRDQQIIECIRTKGPVRSSEIHSYLVQQGGTQSLITVKRSLSDLGSKKILAISGKGPSTAYTLSEYGKLTLEVNATEYCIQEPDGRSGAHKYNFELFSALDFEPFSKQEVKVLSEATQFYQNKIKNISDAIHTKELERFVIELSWKSSKIEGNTYSLLDTEQLILHGVEAPGHLKTEAVMILNHKEAFQYINKNRHQFKSISRPQIEDIHKLLIKNLHVQPNLRSKPVGVTGSVYRPLDNSQQILEALEALSAAVERMPSGYAKALVALLGISYIQPFEDGNKRTGRLVANAILLAHGLSPLSYRSVSEKEYREATLVFYELHSLVPFKKIFVEQYDFAARNYLAR